MNSEIIREKNKAWAATMKEAGNPEKASFILQAAHIEMMIEIAAQLAELNENIKAKSLTAHCDICGTKFMAVMPWAKYCSAECHKEATKLQKREKRGK